MSKRITFTPSAEQSGMLTKLARKMSLETSMSVNSQQAAVASFNAGLNKLMDTFWPGTSRLQHPVVVSSRKRKKGLAVPPRDKVA